LRAPAVSGWGQLVWDGTDTAGDPVSNGVYIYKVTASSTADRTEKADFIGKAVVLR
jgi:flagellar hook assembly protein FlgD